MIHFIDLRADPQEGYQMDVHAPIVAEFLRYNCWANLKLIDTLCSLTAKQLDWTAAGVYGSISDTLRHLVSSEANYHRRITGVVLPPPFDWEAQPEMTAIRAYAQQVGEALAAAADRMQWTDTLERDWNDEEWEGYPSHFRAVGMLIQALHHANEHRTNITTILAQHGISDVYLSGWEYIRLNPVQMGD
jgi:uncharacterized damage-inducible protein DinB